MNKKLLIVALTLFIVSPMIGYNVGRLVAVSRSKSVRVENNLLVPVTTNAMVLVTNTLTVTNFVGLGGSGAPPGYKIIVSNDGKWNFVMPQGFEGILQYATKQEALDMAWYYYNFWKEREGRTWTEVK